MKTTPFVVLLSALGLLQLAPVACGKEKDDEVDTVGMEETNLVAMPDPTSEPTPLPTPKLTTANPTMDPTARPTTPQPTTCEQLKWHSFVEFDGDVLGCGNTKPPSFAPLYDTHSACCQGVFGSGGCPKQDICNPTAYPTKEPTPEPTQEPTQEPTPEPTQEPTKEPTVEPTPSPINPPEAKTEEATQKPTKPSVTFEPTFSPNTSGPTPSLVSLEPTSSPVTPDSTISPTKMPTNKPSPSPVASEESTSAPTVGPTEKPTPQPTDDPTKVPTTAKEDKYPDLEGGEASIGYGIVWDPTASPTRCVERKWFMYQVAGKVFCANGRGSEPPYYDSFDACCRAQNQLHSVPVEECAFVPSICGPTPPTPSQPVPTSSPTIRPTVCGERGWYINDPGGVCTNFPAPAPTDSTRYNSLEECCEKNYGGSIVDKCLYVDFCGTPETPEPTRTPSGSPTTKPTAAPTKGPTDSPSKGPTTTPTKGPTASPTKGPTRNPTGSPSDSPTSSPTLFPTLYPTLYPTISPSLSPTFSPTDNPTDNPTEEPTISPTEIPTFNPTYSNMPSYSTGGLPIRPTRRPTRRPTDHPTQSPTQRRPIFTKSAKSKTNKSSKTSTDLTKTAKVSAKSDKGGKMAKTLFHKSSKSESIKTVFNFNEGSSYTPIGLQVAKNTESSFERSGSSRRVGVRSWSSIGVFLVYVVTRFF